MFVNMLKIRRQGFVSELAILAFYWLCCAVLVPLCIAGLSRYFNS